MKNSLGFALFISGLVVGVLLSYTHDLMDQQKGYEEGRESVLSSTVSVGEEDSPCQIEIPLSVLAEMVSVGVLEWQAACSALATRDDG